MFENIDFSGRSAIEHPAFLDKPMPWSRHGPMVYGVYGAPGGYGHPSRGINGLMSILPMGGFNPA
jgi:hypothetical protein